MVDKKITLYELTVEAGKKVEQYRHPNLKAWIQAIDPVLEAAGANKVGADHVDHITVDDEGVNIQTAYTVRGCEQTQYMELPMAILKADNPVQAATQYRLEEALKDARYQLSVAEKTMLQWQERIDALMLEISTVQKDS